ncbi:MAG TPA: DUF881 domain-containing protein [Nocardioides sp.]|uniref:DUF881 domain-containing protein n=1 Tax=Nocardioides sp. TaxID=35761 RepID=UPI002CECB162|nr:DUF881 domain-containing protein [Nocardioides sp.]HQR26500.1 DUF881 domain-containing protein [Nocardioides sp.]
MPERPSDQDPAPPAGVTDPAAQPARARLRTALLRPSRGQVVVAVLLAGLGFAAVTQVRANELDNTYAGYREQDLIAVLNTMTSAAERAQGEIARLESTRQDLRTDTLRHSAALQQARQEVDTLAILAGQVPVSGPGIRVTITETDGEVSVNSLLDTIQELRTAGAEAIEINDQVRVVAQTSFADAVGGVLVGGTLVTSPYTLEVIGDPATLEAAMVFPQGPVDQLEDDGATVTVDQVPLLRIESVHTASRPEYAQPGTEQ